VIFFILFLSPLPKVTIIDAFNKYVRIITISIINYFFKLFRFNKILLNNIWRFMKVESIICLILYYVNISKIYVSIR